MKAVTHEYCAPDFPYTPHEFDMRLLQPVHEIIEFGMRIDKDEQHRLLDSHIEEWNSSRQKLNSVVGQEVNVNSHVQMKEILYDRLGLPVRKHKGKPTTREAALRSLMAICEDKVRSLKTESAKERWMRGYLVCRLTLNDRGLKKRMSSYLGVSIRKNKIHTRDFVDPDGRLRTTISIGGTETGRFSHSKTLWDTGLNAATIPRELRSMIIADEGYELAEFDLNRGESWIYAHLSEDPELLRIHVNGLDFHAETAATISEAFGEQGLTVEWIVQHKDGEAYKIRFLGKKVNHASSYRMGPYKGAETVNDEADDTGITVTVGAFREAQKLWKWKYSNIPNKWWPDIEQQLSDARTITTPFGRIRQFHDFWGKSLFKEATAYVPQSTSVDYLNHGMLRVFEEFQAQGAWDLHLLNQSHDSILVQYKEEDRDEAIQSIADTLRSRLVISGREFVIPIEAQYGKAWGDHPELGDLTDYDLTG